MKKSAILEAVHETPKGLHQAGVMDQVTLREFDRQVNQEPESEIAQKPQGSPRDLLEKWGGAC